MKVNNIFFVFVYRKQGGASVQMKMYSIIRPEWQISPLVIWGLILSMALQYWISFMNFPEMRMNVSASLVNSHVNENWKQFTFPRYWA